MIDYEKTKAWRSDPVRHTYTERDTILYALGVGFAADDLPFNPEARAQLPPGCQ